MGTFASYVGSMNIPDQLADTFSDQMIRILNYGGMAELQHISMYGHKIALIKPVEFISGGEVCFYYNYFEDDSWETAKYDAGDCYLYTGKIGNQEFNHVIRAAYSLYELYDSLLGFPLIDGRLFDPYPHIAWINNLLGTNFSMEKRKKILDIIEVNYENFMKGFIKLLDEVDDKYYRIFPFQNMFYDFVYNGHCREYRAAINLLRELSDENWKEEGITQIRDPGRLNIKRYMSIMANQLLRKKYFDF